MTPADPVQSRERAFWNAEAAALEPDSLPPRPPDEYEASLLDALGPIDGLKVLELGCGAGDLSLELLGRGCDLTATDLSEGMVELARARAARFRPGAPARFHVSEAEHTGLPDGAFDRVVGKWIIHHTDVQATGREIARVLAPGGAGVFFENQDRNPLLRFARRRLMGVPGVERVGTDDEWPLSAADLASLRATFDRMELSYPNLYFFEALSRAVGMRGFARLRAADLALWRAVPPLRRYSYHLVVALHRDA